MAILAKAAQTTANTEQILYTVPTGTEALCAINVCNKTTSSIKVRIGLLSSGETSTAVGGFIEYDTSVPANGVLERTGILLGASERIAVTCDSTSVSYVVSGKTAFV